MISITTIIHDAPSVSQQFLKFSWDGKKRAIDALKNGKLIRDYNASQVIALEDSQQILKLVKPRRMLECVKLLWAASRANKEVQGNLLLSNLGIGVPELVDFGYGFFPGNNYRYIGFMVMEDLSARDCEDVRDMMKKPEFNEVSRNHFFSRLYKDIITMRDHHIIFNDLKLGNMFSDLSGNLVWIDTGVSRYAFYQNKKFKIKYNFSLNRFLERHKDVLSDKEKEQISCLILN